MPVRLTMPNTVLPLCLIVGASLTSCVTEAERRQPAAALPAPRIERLIPNATTAGVGFAVQPSGLSAISVRGADFEHASTIRFGDQDLETTFGDQTALTALVPQALYKNPGSITVTVVNSDGGISNGAAFRVLDPASAPPVSSQLYPSSTAAGVGFNPQPNGDSALAIEGAGFRPGAIVEFGGKSLETTFGTQTALSALVPAALTRTPGIVKIVVKNADGKQSGPATFAIASQAESLLSKTELSHDPAIENRRLVGRDGAFPR